MNEAKVRVVPGPVELAQAGAAFLIRAAESAISDHGYFTIALAGGSTPKKMYELIIGSGLQEALDWSSVHLFFTDERMVPPTDPENNYRMAYDAMLSELPIPEHQVHRIRTEAGDPLQVAQHYEQEIRKVFLRLDPHLGQWPRFDLMLMGLGENGHTASLFPGVNPTEKGAWVIAPWIAEIDAYRISLTYDVINESREVLFLVSGEKKADILSKVLVKNSEKKSTAAGNLYPAQRIHLKSGPITWLVDQAAASKLSSEQAA